MSLILIAMRRSTGHVAQPIPTSVSPSGFRRLLALEFERE
jgi:hypothetical protein